VTLPGPGSNRAESVQQVNRRTKRAAKVVAVTDGDTIKVTHNGVAERIRLWCIDCPESNQAFGTRAKTLHGRFALWNVVTVRTRDLPIISSSGGVRPFGSSSGIHRVGSPPNSPDCHARKLSRLHSDLALQRMSIEKVDIGSAGIVAISATPENSSSRFIESIIYGLHIRSDLPAL